MSDGLGARARLRALKQRSTCSLVGSQETASRRKEASYLVDPASSHMLVSKIKPCMSKYTLWHSETANGSLNQLWFIGSCLPMWITVVILELIHATGPDFTKGRFY